jgi:hypothetical protein
MRFIADDPRALPVIGTGDVVNGQLTPDCLATLSHVSGTLLVRVQNSDALKKLEEIGTLEALGAAPTHAYYSSVRISPGFFRNALLNHTSGLVPATVTLGLGEIPPGHPDWERTVATGFLASNYEPILKAAEALGDDQAFKLPMPEIRVAGDGSFSLDIALGWALRRGDVPSPPGIFPGLESVPVRAFLRHIAKKLREPVLDGKGADALTIVLFGEQDSSVGWHAGLRAALQEMGFGPLSGDSPIDTIVREFQIAASSANLATSKLPARTDQQLAKRDFRDLMRILNPEPYTGVISGRANRETRRLIAAWKTGGLRNPLVITAFSSGDIEPDELPAAAAEPAITDVWLRDEVKDETKRMFAADFTRVDAPAQFGNKDLERLGYFTPYELFGGPRNLSPNAVNRVDFAEVTPQRLFAGVPAVLIRALTDVHPDPVLYAQASTFRVVRAVSEQECIGYLDQLTAYDSAVISVGLFQMSMSGARKKPGGGTELGGLAAYCRFLENSGAIAGADFFKRQGLSAVSDPVGKSTRGAYFRVLCFLDDRGDTRSMLSAAHVDFMASWRSVYRWVWLGRSSESFGAVNWAMALRRLKRIVETPIVMMNYPDDPRQAAGSPPTIGSVFTSEILMAWLLRWHVKKSIGVITRPETAHSDRASIFLTEAYQQAASYSPGTDDDEWQTQLRAGLLNTLKKFQVQYEGNNDLSRNFRDIELPQWAAAPPHRPGRNDHAYGLDPRLRLCSLKGGSFKLAPQIVDP